MAEFLEAFGVGGFMDAVDGGLAAEFDFAGDEFVGQEHEFFDELVGDVVFYFFEADGQAVGVKDDFDFGEVEVEGAILEAGFAQEGGEFPGGVEA